MISSRQSLRRRFFLRGCSARFGASSRPMFSMISGAFMASAKRRAQRRMRRRSTRGWMSSRVLRSAQSSGREATAFMMVKCSRRGTRTLTPLAITCGRYVSRSIRALNSGHSAYRRLTYVHGSRTTRISSSIWERLPRIFASSHSSSSCWRPCSAVLRHGACRTISSINSWYRLRASAFVLDRGMI